MLNNQHSIFNVQGWVDHEALLKTCRAMSRQV